MACRHRLGIWAFLPLITVLGYHVADHAGGGEVASVHASAHSGVAQVANYSSFVVRTFLKKVPYFGTPTPWQGRFAYGGAPWNSCGPIWCGPPSSFSHTTASSCLWWCCRRLNLWTAFIARLSTFPGGVIDLIVHRLLRQFLTLIVLLISCPRHNISD